MPARDMQPDISPDVYPSLSRSERHGETSGDTTRRLDRTTQRLSKTRQNLTDKGIIYAPEHGRVAFTVPWMAAFIGRQAT